MSRYWKLRKRDLIERPMRCACGAKRSSTPSARSKLGWERRATHFLTKTIPKVSTETSLHVLAYNLKRMMQILGVKALMQVMQR